MRTWDTEYPRPLLKRDSFLPLHEGWTLNGRPVSLPWPPQARLSGWEGPVGEELHYELRFSLPGGFLKPGHRLLLHIDGADQICRVRVNGTEAAAHEGGYLPFAADITDLTGPGVNTLEADCTDTMSEDYPYGKQSRRPHGMWYTQMSGIWKQVWLEAVPERNAVTGLRLTPDLTGVTLEVETMADTYTVSVPEAGIRQVCRGRKNRIEIPEPRLWSPEDPHLYTLLVETDAEQVESFFALRTVTVEKTGGHARLCLNGKPVFLHAVLDQGYFADGLCLPASPEEYDRDVERMKQMGFNALRKHLKVEPEAFYCACDRLGMLVIQDMVNSGHYSYVRDTVLPTLGVKRLSDTRRRDSPRRREIFERHVRDTQRHLYSHPCVIGYTIFNEGWGQYDSDRIYGNCREEDPTRFYVSASGWFAQGKSDVQSEHIYFRNEVLRAKRSDQFLLLSECGGFSMRVPGHVDGSRKNYGYGKVEQDGEGLTARIRELYEQMVLPSIPLGLCGCVYTQLSDVEGETNGLYTWDRQVRKVELLPMLEIAERVQRTFAECTGGQTGQ